MSPTPFPLELGVTFNFRRHAIVSPGVEILGRLDLGTVEEPQGDNAWYVSGGPTVRPSARFTPLGWRTSLLVGAPVALPASNVPSYRYGILGGKFRDVETTPYRLSFGLDLGVEHDIAP